MSISYIYTIYDVLSLSLPKLVNSLFAAEVRFFYLSWISEIVLGMWNVLEIPQQSSWCTREKFKVKLLKPFQF